MGKFFIQFKLMKFQVIEDKETQKRKAVERANAYRDMMNTWAWKDLEKIIEEIRTNAFRTIDNAPVNDVLNLQVVYSKGVRAGLTQMLSEINFLLGEGGYAERT